MENKGREMEEVARWDWNRRGEVIPPAWLSAFKSKNLGQETDAVR